MFCFYCQSGKIPKSVREKGFIWIHLHCFRDLLNSVSNIEEIKKIISKEKNESISSFLERMEKFDNYTKKMIDKVWEIKD